MLLTMLEAHQLITITTVGLGSYSLLCGVHERSLEAIYKLFRQDLVTEQLPITAHLLMLLSPPSSANSVG